MAQKRRERAPRPVCSEHWQKMRSEAMKVLPFWSRPFASGTVEKTLRKQGFVPSDTECAYCKTATDVDQSE